MGRLPKEDTPGAGNLSILTKVDKLRELIGTRVALPQANEAMGISTSSHATNPNDSPLPAFSEHILKIEKLGPNEDHFTVIDVPGIFRQETQGVTTESDIELVMSMVKKYIHDSRTIILAIMPSNVDPATQEILKLAKKADPTMTRTMAVLTKPDLAIERATQQIAIDHVLGKRGDLTLGYYVVKNRGPDDADKTLQQGQVEERIFFSSAPWSVLVHTGRAGVVCLKQRVRELLVDLIKKEFPKLKSEVSKELAIVRAHLDEMGPSRSDQHTQRAYLNRMSEAFQSVTRDALTASYTRDRIFSDRQDLRLITRVVEASECYADEMLNNGHMRPFLTDKKEDEDATDEQCEDDEGAADEQPEDSSSCKPASKKVPSISEKQGVDFGAIAQDYPELEEIFDSWGVSKDDTNTCGIMDYIEGVYKSSRGQDLGAFGNGLLGTLFQEQSKKWENITMEHMSVVIYHVHRFISEVVKSICPDPRVHEELWNGYLLEELLTFYRKAMDHAKFLLRIEREGSPLTLMDLFSEHIQKIRTNRLVNAITDLGVERVERSEDEPDGKSKKQHHENYIFLKPSHLRNLTINKGNATQVREHMHDLLSSYYAVARQRFVDVIYQQAVNHYLLFGEKSPLKTFNTEMVLSLNEEQLDMIAAEDAPVKQRREKLVRDIDNLVEALKVLKGSR
ncbi:interferon-induced GTP-binding protein Mx2 [Xylaria castorea]|nr:interferon-induced GTP-binding protein Mx2 [Xylaria castorea]